jgi:phage/plasmid-like protein (TIGR03299 family)
MPHEITVRENGFAEIAFVGATPWHGLGQELTRDASLEDWRREAGLDWHIKKAPVMYDNDNVLTPYPGQHALYRSDNGAPLSIVSSKYNVVQPVTVLEFFSELVETKGYRLHTAGTLKGGRRIWALAEVGKVEEVVSNDPVAGFLLLATSCDKGLATTARFTSVRVVCANTLAAAERSMQYVSIDHTQRFDIAATHEALGIQTSSFETFMAQARELSRKNISNQKFEQFLQSVLTPVTVGAKYGTLGEFDWNTSRAYQAISNLMAGGGRGSELPGVSGTYWGAVNAVTEYFDHHRPARNADLRLNTAWFSWGARTKQRALEVALSA